MVSDQPITVFRGERATLSFTVTSGSVSGRTVMFTVATQKNHAAKLLSKAAVVAVGGESFTVTLTATDTDLAPGNYHWDAWITDAGFQEIVASGSFVLAANVRVPAS